MLPVWPLWDLPLGRPPGTSRLGSPARNLPQGHPPGTSHQDHPSNGTARGTSSRNLLAGSGLRNSQAELVASGGYGERQRAIGDGGVMGIQNQGYRRISGDRSGLRPKQLWSKLLHTKVRRWSFTQIRARNSGQPDGRYGWLNKATGEGPLDQALGSYLGRPWHWRQGALGRYWRA